MVRRLAMTMALLAGSVLAMPQGWCCLVLAMTCGPRTAAPTATSSPTTCPCCQAKAEHKACCPDDDPGAPAKPVEKCNLCVSASHKPPVKITGDDFLLDAVSLLPVPAAWSVPSAVLEDATPVLETGPPRHVRLCVWRC